ncbi:MAG: cob(I)yrinic acid a,c-diamide adenosyltransferase [Deltaproteobacteria bacterium]|nr:cob(I)yrinic acid a,c-diamide adenosyltransferase [Deltaproteobacteria bacterium]
MAIRITRVYTRTGDDGTTGLVGGKRVPKDSERVEAYGTIDELNAVVGLVRTWNEQGRGERELRLKLDGWLQQIQQELFDLGSEMATPEGFTYDGMHRVGAAEVTGLEQLINECQKDLKPLKSFTLPGGGPISAQLHQCRTVCRRAEREILRLSRVEDVGEWPLKYVNRLSDFFYVVGRWVGKNLGETEYLWQRGLTKGS